MTESLPDPTPESSDDRGAVDRRAALGAGLLGVGALGAAAFSGRAGPIDPPSGPIEPTGRTTEEVYAVAQRGVRLLSTVPATFDTFHFISEPGHYILDRDIDAGSSNLRGLLYVQASDVTIDLNGHTLTSKGPATYGVRFVGVSNQNLTVRNGTIDCLGGGILASGRSGVRAERLVIRNASSTEPTGGPYGVGILAGRNAVVTDCTITNSNSTSFQLGDNATLKRCSADINLNFAGFSLGHNCSLEDCRTTGAGSNGFQIGDNCVLLRCVSVGADTNAYLTGNSCTIERCTAASAVNGSGFKTGVNCIVSGCTARLNDVYGIEAGEQNVLENNAVNANGSGVLLRKQGICRNSLIDFHTAFQRRGIIVGSECLVDDNLISRNYYAIHCTGLDAIFRRNFFSSFTNLYENLGTNHLPLATPVNLTTAGGNVNVIA